MDTRPTRGFGGVTDVELSFIRLKLIQRTASIYAHMLSNKAGKISSSVFDFNIVWALIYWQIYSDPSGTRNTSETRQPQAEIDRKVFLIELNTNRAFFVKVLATPWTNKATQDPVQRCHTQLFITNYPSGRSLVNIHAMSHIIPPGDTSYKWRPLQNIQIHT